MTDDNPPIKQFSDAVLAGDTATMRSVLSKYPTAIADAGLSMQAFINDAIDQDDPELLATLVELGADINEPQSSYDPEGCIRRAAGFGNTSCVRWLLDHGAQINHTVNGVTRCFALSSASLEGHIDIVKLLVERGAAFNYDWGNKNPLSLAMAFGRKEVVEYLRSKGALLPWEVRGEAPPQIRPSTPVIDHITRHFGTPEPLSIEEIARGDPSIRIHIVSAMDCKALITEGMSSKALSVPRGGEKLQFAELLMFLPPDWPTDAASLDDPNWSWPIEWLRRVSLFPHQHHTWLGISAVFANEEPPQPLAPNSQLSCILVIKAPEDFGTLRIGDDKQIVFYHMIPLYTEERDLERAKGVGALLERFEDRGISRIVDMQRPNVA